jgi:PKHD-type hydroxylase
MYYQQPVNDPVNYYYYKNIFSEQEIKNILFQLQKIPYENAKVLSGEPTEDIRKSKVKWIPETDDWNWIYKRMLEAALEANQKLWHFDIIKSEMIQYTEYSDKDKGHYNWHQDLGQDIYSHRKISISVQLSDPTTYGGGDLQFWYGGESNTVSVEKSLGEATIFPSYMMHRVTEVNWGTRKSLVLWIGGSHFR